MKFRTFVAVGVCSTSLAQFVIADDQQDPKSKPAPAKVQVSVGDEENHNDQNQGRDHALATCLVIENQGEVAIAKFAEGKTGNSSVKEFAGMLVKEHAAYPDNRESVGR